MDKDLIAFFDKERKKIEETKIYIHKAGNKVDISDYAQDHFSEISRGIFEKNNPF